LKQSGEPSRAVVANLEVRALGKIHPDLLIGDVDHLAVDPLEILRQIRFVLPNCIIAVYSGDTRRSWGLACHLAGANCLLSKQSTQRQLSAGVHDAVDSGCYTDPRFVA
jgi:DNA-binding NarL/FixJ family response regulator